MWPVLANLNGVKITIFGLGLALAFLIASFVAWRQMRSEYAEEDILSLAIVLAVLGLIAGIGWRILSIGGLLVIPGLGLFLWCRQKEWNIWEWLDTLGPVSLLVGAIGAIAWGLVYSVASGVLLLGVVVMVFLRKNYRKLHWYKNGKVGFVGLVSIMWWLVAWITIANWHVSRVYWGGLSLEAWISVWALIAACLTLYIRGGRRISQDWRQLTKIWQAKRNK